MTSLAQLPEPIQRLVSMVAPGADVRLVAQSDLSPDGSYGDQWLILAGDRVLVAALASAQPKVLVDLPLKDISEVDIESLVGGSALRATVNGLKADLLSFSNALISRFGRVRAQLDALAKGKPMPQVEDTFNRCPSCGLALDDATRVCPRCIRRGAVLRRLLGYTKPYRSKLILSGAFMLLGTASGLVPPYLTKILVDKVLVPRHNAHLLGWLVIGLAAASLMNTGMEMWRGRITAWLAGRISFDIRSALYDRLQWLTMRYYDRHPTGTIISRITQDAGGVQDFLGWGFPWAVSNIITVIGVAVMLLIIDWRLALLAMIPTPLVILLFRGLWSRLTFAYHGFWYRWSRFYGQVSDALGRVKVIKAFSQQPMEIDRYQLRNRDLFNASVYAEQTSATIFPVVWMVIGAGSLFVWYFGGLSTLRGSVTLGGLMAFIGYLGMLYAPLDYLTQAAQWMSRAITAAERIFEVLDAEYDSEKSQGQVVPKTIHGNIEYRGVSFGYEKHQPVIKDITFSVAAGQMLGLMGRSGSGKSTIINLLCRFYDCDEGEILVDGINLRNLSLSAYRGRLGAVLQEPFLFSGTIAENIAYGKPSATLEEIMSVAKLANAHDFIVAKPDGYDEQVGERGGRLSAGEKQRICIARAILHDPVILILDEATANVDLETEEQIQQAIQRLVAGRTTFAIAHRLSTLRAAHNLLVIEEGKLAEFGTHDELEQKRGVYYGLLDLHRKISMTRGGVDVG